MSEFDKALTAYGEACLSAGCADALTTTTRGDREYYQEKVYAARRAVIAAADRDTSALRAERDAAQDLAREMISRADRVSLFLSAFANLVAAGMSVRVPDDQIPESGVFTVVAKARHCREFNEAMQKALDADRPPNYLRDRLQAVEAELAAVRADCAQFCGENERFRKALEAIEARWTQARRHHDCGDYERGYGQAEADIGQFARAALHSSPAGKEK